MSTITVKIDKRIANYDALEAVRHWMIVNHQERHHFVERTVCIRKGLRVKVRELAQKKGMSICSALFSVKKVGA